MPDPSAGPSFHTISERAADMLDGVAPRLVTIHGRRRGTSSGFLWRLGLAVTAEETENFPVMRALRDVELTAADMAFVNGTA